MSIADEKCETCKYCDTVQQPRGEATICRGDTPKVFLVPSQTLHGNVLQATTIWPSIDPIRDYCSKHTLRLAQVVKDN